MIKLGYKLDSASQYNYELLEGIISCQNNNFNESIIKLTSAEQSRREFSDPLIYKCLSKIA
jgi:protein involved in ribonucleotide reduction